MRILKKKVHLDQRNYTGCVSVFQARNVVYFFVTDPIFLFKILIPDLKNEENFDPWNRKNLISDPWSLIPDPIKNTADLNPTRCDSRCQGCDPWSHIPSYDPVICCTNYKTAT